MQAAAPTDARSLRPTGRPSWKTLLSAISCGIPAGAGVAVASVSVSPLAGAGAIVGLLGLIFILVSPTVSLMAVAVSLPLERIGRMTEDFSSYTISLSRIVGLVALGALLVHVLLGKKRVRFGLAFWLYAGYVAIGLMGVMWALQQEDAQRDSVRVLGNLLFFFLIINLVTRYQMVRLGMTMWLIASTGSSLYGVYQYHLGQTENVEESQMGKTSTRFTAVVSDDSETSALGQKVKRVYGTTSHPGLFGLNMAMTIPFFAWIMRGRSNTVKLLWAGAFAICVYGMLLSNTRFVLVLGLLMLAATVLRGLFDFRPHTWVGIGLLAVLALPFIPSDIYMRSLDPSLYSTQKSGSIRIRFKMLDKSVDLLSEHWLLGIGMGNQDIIPALITDEQGGRITPAGVKASAHNEFLWSMVEVGIFGWLFHWSFVVLVIAASFRAAKRLRRLPAESDQYWFLVAAQIMLIGVPLFGVQSEVFHYSLKGWWFVAGIVWVMWTAVRRLPAIAAHPKTEVQPA